MDAFTPQQTIELVSRIGCKKAHMRLDKLFFNSCMTGPLLGSGCAWLLSTNAAPWYQENAPGLIRTVGALMFPIGLVLITLTGSDLFTSNIMFMTTAFLSRRVHIVDVAKSWFVSFFGNLAGTLFFMALITGYGGVFEESEAYRSAAVTFAVHKAQDPGWHQIFLRAIGANWLVCLAVFLSISARDIVSKIIAIWFPTACFVALALDHVVANMFFIPTGIWCGAPFGVSYYIWKSMIPTLLGNMLGGGFFVGTVYWYLYLTGEGEGGVRVEFDLGGMESALEAGGPMGREGRFVRSAPIITRGLSASSALTNKSMAKPQDRNIGDEEKAIEGLGVAAVGGRHSSSSPTGSIRGRDGAASHGFSGDKQEAYSPSRNPSYPHPHPHPYYPAQPPPGTLVSAFGQEMSDRGPYAKTWAERMEEKKREEEGRGGR